MGALVVSVGASVVEVMTGPVVVSVTFIVVVSVTDVGANVVDVTVDAFVVSVDGAVDGAVVASCVVEVGLRVFEGTVGALVDTDSVGV